MLALRRSDVAALDETVNSIAARSSDTPLQLTYKLAWRGSVHAFWGNAAASEADLAEVTTRIRTGVADNSDGIYNGLLAFARWQTGAWNLADVEMRIALDHVVGQPHPMLRAIEPVLRAARGDFGQADKKLREAADVLEVMPWREPVHLYVISYVARLHAGADPAARKMGLQHLRTVFGDSVLEIPGFTGVLWIFHLAIAAIWAGDLDLAAELTRQSESQPHPPHWMEWVPAWLRGLAAETAGAIEQARQHLDAAVAGFTDDMPLYRAHVLADHARVAALQHDDAAARRSLDAAGQLYRVLGAVPYLARLNENAEQPQPGSLVEVDVLSVLSERERDVATLLVSGLTYAQIARDLYVTRATVGFHTGRIYAKTGVASRAELIDLVRRRRSRTPELVDSYSRTGPRQREPVGTSPPDTTRQGNRHDHTGHARPGLHRQDPERHQRHRLLRRRAVRLPRPQRHRLRRQGRHGCRGGVRHHRPHHRRRRRQLVRRLAADRRQAPRQGHRGPRRRPRRHGQHVLPRRRRGLLPGQRRRRSPAPTRRSPRRRSTCRSSAGRPSSTPPTAAPSASPSPTSRSPFPVTCSAPTHPTRLARPWS